MKIPSLFSFFRSNANEIEQIKNDLLDIKRSVLPQLGDEKKITQNTAENLANKLGELTTQVNALSNTQKQLQATIYNLSEQNAAPTPTFFNLKNTSLSDNKPAFSAEQLIRGC